MPYGNHRKRLSRRVRLMWKSPDTDGIPPFVSLAILPQHRLASSFLASVPRSSSSTVRLFQVQQAMDVSCGPYLSSLTCRVGNRVETKRLECGWRQI
eukprot:scaffold1303_cov194-Alexandrium_tamarense.AAC.6